MNKKVLGIEKLESKTLLSVVPNDPLLNNQWGLNNTSSYGAWTNTVGSKDVVVAVIDSGIDLTHQDLKNNVWTNPGEIPGDGIDNEGDGYIDDVNGWNFFNNTNVVQDNYGHGTHIAGIIGAEGSNSLGVAGVDWHVSIMPLKFMDDRGLGGNGGAIQAMEYLLMMKNTYHVNVVAVNTSWESMGGFSSMMYGEIQKLNDANIILTVAAGNSGVDTDVTLKYPSCYDSPNIISVGALDIDGVNLAGLSNYGKSTVDLAAPGTMIYSTLPWNSYGNLTGTSMAAPFVAGTVALLNSLKPNLSVAEAKAIIFGSVDKIPSLFDKVATGGRLNIGAAVDSLLGIPHISNQLPIGNITSQTLNTVSGWVQDPDGAKIVNMQLWIDSKLVSTKMCNYDGSFSFNLGGLTIGDHVINIKAQDGSTKGWVDIASSAVKVPPPVVVVTSLSINRIRGYAYSERSLSSAATVRIYINNRLVSSQLANRYSIESKAAIGYSYHGFNIILNRNWFRRGTNDVKVVAYDPVSKQALLVSEVQLNK